MKNSLKVCGADYIGRIMGSLETTIQRYRETIYRLTNSTGSSAPQSKARFQAGRGRITSTSQRPVIQKILDRIIDAFVVSVVVMASFCILFVAVDWLWGIYQSTHIGQQFMVRFPERAKIMEDILSCDCLILSFDLVVATLIVSSVVGAVAKFFYFQQYGYMNRSIVLKLALWILPISALSGLMVNEYYMFDIWWTAILLSVWPTLLLLPVCFRAADEFIPEMGAVFSGIRNGINDLYNWPDLLRRFKKFIKKLNTN